jgi:hypothetical protein
MLFIALESSMISVDIIGVIKYIIKNQKIKIKKKIYFNKNKIFNK